MQNYLNKIGSYQNLDTWCLMIIAAVAATVALIYTKSILIPFVIATLMYNVVAPMVRWQVKALRMPKILALSLSGVVILGIISLIVVFISNSVNSFINGAGVYSDKFFAALNWCQALLAKYGYEVPLQSVESVLRELPIFDLVQKTSRTAFSFLSMLLIAAIILVFFFVASGADKTEEKKKETRQALLVKNIQVRISRYLLVKTVVSFVTGCFIWVLLAAFGVELALLFGIITFLLNYIPNIGSTVAVILPIPVMMLQFGMGPKFWFVLVLSIAVQMTIGNFIEPRIIGSGVGLHPVTVILCLIFWGIVWGLIGAFLAVPLTVALKLIFEEFDPTRPIAKLMEGNFF